MALYILIPMQIMEKRTPSTKGLENTAYFIPATHGPTMGLKHAGQKACLWTAFDTGIFLKYEEGRR